MKPLEAFGSSRGEADACRLTQRLPDFSLSFCLSSSLNFKLLRYFPSCCLVPVFPLLPFVFSELGEFVRTMFFK